MILRNCVLSAFTVASLRLHCRQFTPCDWVLGQTDFSTDQFAVCIGILSMVLNTGTNIINSRFPVSLLLGIVTVI